jgi:hypothetical protein
MSGLFFALRGLADPSPLDLHAPASIFSVTMQKSRTSLANLLLDAAGGVDLLIDDRGDTYASLCEPGRTRLLRLHGREFRLWLAERGHALTGQVPGSGALSAALLLLEARAQKGRKVVLWNRVARGPDGAIWLDLADGRAVRITAQGFGLVADPPVLFRRFSHQEPLPAPAPAGDLRGLDAFLNLRDADDTILFYTSLVAALVPDIPQPLLILHGPQGAAKTTTARLRRRLIDPSAMATVLVRREISELVQALDHHYMPILDNLSSLSAWQEEVLCQAATGGGFTKRALYSDQEDVLFRFRRPLVLTGISLPSAAPDLLDRALLIDLERIPVSRRRDERVLWGEFERERPALLGGLLGALSQAMRIEPALALPGLQRMADFTRFGAAAAEALGFGAERFCQALAANAVRQGEEVVEDDPVAEAVQVLVGRVGCFSGSATDLLAALQRVASPQGQAGLPRHAAELGKRLNRLRAPLSELGIQVRWQRQAGGNRQRCWILEGRAGDDVIDSNLPSP